MARDVQILRQLAQDDSNILFESNKTLRYHDSNGGFNVKTARKQGPGKAGTMAFLQFHNVLSLFALGSLDDVEFDVLAFS